MVTRILNLFKNWDNITDGYHTFKQLYEFRHVLFLGFCMLYRNECFVTDLDQNKYKSPGYFIMGLNTKYGQLSFHMPDMYWGLAANIGKVIEYNYDYDGHDSDDTFNILLSLISEQVEKIIMESKSENTGN